MHFSDPINLVSLTLQNVYLVGKKISLLRYSVVALKCYQIWKRHLTDTHQLNLLKLGAEL